MIFNLKLDLGMVKLNHRAEYLGSRSNGISFENYCRYRETDIFQTDCFT